MSRVVPSARWHWGPLHRNWPLSQPRWRWWWEKWGGYVPYLSPSWTSWGAINGTPRPPLFKRRRRCSSTPLAAPCGTATSVR
ncbi:hypothetical protein Sjap_013438 [Stephania japonica]|uniref:Uncharacterized protein n=1 Tax=Stephania japonica TaxID=461633 RepID=A0AAP0P1B1_9MAGN